MRSVTLPSGNKMPAMGLGTWRMGEHRDRFEREVAVIRSALELGVRLLDTAEMYGEGGAEEVIGEAIRGRRDDLFVFSSNPMASQESKTPCIFCRVTSNDLITVDS